MSDTEKTVTVPTDDPRGPAAYALKVPDERLMKPGPITAMEPRSRGIKKLSLLDGTPIEELEQRFEFIDKIARVMADSNLVPKAYRGKVADCFLVIQMGLEVGLEPFQAIQSIAPTGDRPSLWGDALPGLVRASGLCEYIKEWNEEVEGIGTVAHCETKRRGEKEPVVRSFGMKDAALANLLKKDTYQTYPKRMYQMRARSWCLRDVYADVLRGLSVAEEVSDWEWTQRELDRAKPAATKPRRRRATKAAPQQVTSTVEPAPPSPEELRQMQEKAAPPEQERQTEPAPPDTGEPETGVPDQAALDLAYDSLVDALVGALDMKALLSLKSRVREFPDAELRETLKQLYNKRREELRK